VVYLLFALNFALFGLRPFGYHLANIALHGLNAVLVYHLARRLVAQNALSFLAALLFAVHFIHAEAVLWISGVSGVLATSFYLLSILLFLEHLRRWPAGLVSLVLSCFFFTLALLSNEMTVSLPLLLLVLILGFGFGQFAGSLRSLLVRLVPHGALLVVVALYRVGLHGRVPGFWPGNAAFTVNPLIILRNLAYYVVNLILPVRVFFDFLGYEKYIGLTALFQRQADVLLIPLLILAIFAIMGMGLLMRKLSKMGKIGFLCMLVTLIPFLLFRDVSQRLTYLPSVGFCLLLADLFRSRKQGAAWRAKPLLILLVLASLLAVQERNIWWRRAGGQANELLNQMRGFCGQIRTANQLHVVGAPLRLHGAYIFNAGLGSAIRLVCGEDRLVVSQHRDLRMLEGVDLTAGDLVLVCRDGELSPWPRSKNGPPGRGGGDL